MTLDAEILPPPAVQKPQPATCFVTQQATVLSRDPSWQGSPGVGALAFSWNEFLSISYMPDTRLDTEVCDWLVCQSIPWLKRNAQVVLFLPLSSTGNYRMIGKGAPQGQGSDWWENPCLKTLITESRFCQSRVLVMRGPDSIVSHPIRGLQLI